MLFLIRQLPLLHFFKNFFVILLTVKQNVSGVGRGMLKSSSSWRPTYFQLRLRANSFSLYNFLFYFIFLYALKASSFDSSSAFFSVNPRESTSAAVHLRTKTRIEYGLRSVYTRIPKGRGLRFTRAGGWNSVRLRTDRTILK